MAKNLVIVESPAKAKTIEKFLGKDFKVLSSYGHIRDLRTKDLSIDKDNGFAPIYEIPADKKSLVKDLNNAVKNAETVWLASDEDREGEAIAWHLAKVLNLDPAKTKRIVFHEITKDAILNAIENPRLIDLHRVDAQQARRVLDRLVGFELSPVLWKKIKPSLSAGRVQSVAVRLICEREQEVKRFQSEPYFRVTAHFTTPNGNQFAAELPKRLPTEEAARQFLTDCRHTVFTVGDVTVKPVKKSPAPPFTTSTLQQEASRRLGFTVSQTMVVAQKLYEEGYITYMRTDSLNLSNLAMASISAEITKRAGSEYLKPRKWHTSTKGAQEAHEAIRPTYINRTTIDGSPREQRLYSLIWKRTMASQMADAEMERTTAEIEIATRPGEHFSAQGQMVKFDGFLKVYLSDSPDDDSSDSSETDSLLPMLKPGMRVTDDDITATERYTQQPPRYTEASLVRKLEELGIGRPSTYAPTISTIQQREYVEKGESKGESRKCSILTLKDGEIASTTKTEQFGAEKGKLIPTDTGIIVNEYLTNNFTDILDYEFTARMEEQFDKIAEGESQWSSEIKEFYNRFHPQVETASAQRSEHKVGERYLGQDPEGTPVYVKIGRFGPVVQIGEGSSDQKPRFASLSKGQSIFEITLPEALKLFDLPRSLGQYEGKEVKAAIGRFGPYISHASKFVSIPKDMTPQTITLDQAIALIEAKREADQKKVVKSFSEDPDIQVLNGRFGVYIVCKKKNYKLPKTVTDPATLTLEECRRIVADAPDTKSKATIRRRKSTK